MKYFGFFLGIFKWKTYKASKCYWDVQLDEFYTSVGQNFENFETFRKIPTEINFRKMVTKFFFRILFFRNQNFSKIYSKISKNP